VRVRSLALALLVPLTPLLALMVPAGGASAPLTADAGASSWSLDGAALAMKGAAIGGTPPYTVSWTYGGSSARFGAPGSLATSFDATGLASGFHTLNLSVTDSLGAVSTDSVIVAVDHTSKVLEGNVSLTAPALGVVGGVPLTQGSLGFDVAAGTGRIQGTASWSNGNYDLDFDLVDPSGNNVGGTQGESSSDPEAVTIDNPVAGHWTALVKGYLNGPVTAHVVVTASPASPIAITAPPARMDWGTHDVQHVFAFDRTGTGPFTFSWDADNDGIFETPGDQTNLSLSVGDHVVGSRVVDGNGLRVDATFPAVVHPVDRVLSEICGGDPFYDHWAMEYSATHGTCWIHDGHHTYYFGGATYAFRSMDGIAYSVEQMFAPPTEVAPSADPTTKLHVESSLDGTTWTELGTADYVLLTERQTVDIHLTGSGQEFRFLRVHEPLSASQGLSGYLDHTQFLVQADDVSAAPVNVTTTAGVKPLDCAQGQVMEAFFATHPCTFGGVDRYDAASFFHTYVAGQGATLTGVGGSFTLAPFRQDDWFEGHETEPQTTLAYVEVSTDGVSFQTVASVNATYGVPQTFHVDLPGTQATFVRLFPEYHASFDDYVNNAPLHHARGYFLASNVTLEGSFP